jgi:D-arabinose 1-dehydrogenase-like Zn-dependent alcohol dehydrogenase
VKAVAFRDAKNPPQVEEFSIPEVGETDVLVRVKAAGICHSDLHTINGLYPVAKVPMILGHEGAGVVEKKGKRVSNVSEGDRVAVDYVVSCGSCEYCRAGRHNLCNDAKYYGWNFDGTWAEYMLVRRDNVFRLPDEVSFEYGALAGCAVVTGYHVMKMSGMKEGNSVAIIGLGGVGTQLLQWSKIFGASEIIGIDLDDYKLRLASKLGATGTVNARQEGLIEGVKKLTGGKGVDIAFEAIGLRDTIEKMIPIVKKAGKAIIVGMCYSTIGNYFRALYKLRHVGSHIKGHLADILHIPLKLRKILHHQLHRMPRYHWRIASHLMKPTNESELSVSKMTEIILCRV